MTPLSPEELLVEAVGCLDEAFSALCKVRNFTGDPAVSHSIRRTLRSIEALEEVVL